MKGLSILLSLGLLVGAHQMARRMKRSGSLPAEHRPAAALNHTSPSGRNAPAANGLEAGLQI